jgi:hypothetical protein
MNAKIVAFGGIAVDISTIKAIRKEVKEVSTLVDTIEEL